MITNGTYLQEQSIIIEGIKIYVSPYQPRFFDWAFNVDRGPIIKQKWDQIPDDTEILITHGPPYGILDRTPRGESVGCRDLLDTIQHRLTKLKLHVFGHIHHSYGIREVQGIWYVNASICTEAYVPSNKPIVLDYFKTESGTTIIPGG